MIELSVELGKYTIDCGELCHYASFTFETRLDDTPPELAELAGISLADYVEPQFAPDWRVEKGFVPLKTTKFTVMLVGEGKNNSVRLGTVMFKKVGVVVKKISEQYVAVLQLSFGDVTCSERLNSWLFQNSKKIVDVQLEQIQMELPFAGDNTTTLEDVEKAENELGLDAKKAEKVKNAAKKFKKGCEALVDDPKSCITGVSMEAGGKKTKIA